LITYTHAHGHLRDITSVTVSRDYLCDLFVLQWCGRGRADCV